MNLSCYGWREAGVTSFVIHRLNVERALEFMLLLQDSALQRIELSHFISSDSLLHEKQRKEERVHKLGIQ